MTLDRAAHAAATGEWRKCLTGLLEAWREQRTAELGDAIERVSAILEQGRPPPSGKKCQAEWLAMAAKGDVADIGLLADSACDLRPGEAESNLEAMLAWPPDPRVGRAMFIRLQARHFSDRRRAWALVGDLILRNADARLRPALERLANGERIDNPARDSCLARVTWELERASARENEPVDGSALERIYAAAETAHTERQFIDAIVADESDAPRLIYADWLTERGHPRGELIVLQCAAKAGTATAKEKARISELFAEHPRALVGALANFLLANLSHAVTNESVVFDRGLVRALPLTFAPPVWSFAESPLVRAVRTVYARGRGAKLLPDFVRIAGSVTTVRHADFGMLTTLCQLPVPSSIEHISVEHWRNEEEPLEEQLPGLIGVGLSRLKSFEFVWHQSGGPRSNEDYETVLPDEVYAAPMMANVERFAFSPNAKAHIAGFRKHGHTKLRTITLVQIHWNEPRLDLHLDDNLVPRVLELLPHPKYVAKMSDFHWGAFRMALEHIDPSTIREVILRPSIELTPKMQTELEAIVASRYATKLNTPLTSASMQVR